MICLRPLLILIHIVDRVLLLLPIVHLLLLLLRLRLVLLRPLRLRLLRLIRFIICCVFPYLYYSYCIVVVVMVPFSFVLLLSYHSSHDDSYVSSCYGCHVS